MKLDQFFTKPSVAKELVDKLNAIAPLSDFKTIVEPSAGDGVWLSPILKLAPAATLIALDLDPKHPNVKKQNFLDYRSHLEASVLFIGNPPFGLRSQLAKKFILKSIELNADAIAFILPSTFSKYNQVKFIPEEWSMIMDEPLSTENYRLPDAQEEYSVPTRFYQLAP